MFVDRSVDICFDCKLYNLKFSCLSEFICIRKYVLPSDLCTV
jgi:hypothetical protein